MKLLCSSISEGDVDERGQVLDDFTRGLENNDILEMLDIPDYPSHLRLKPIFDSSFQRLSAQEKEALVSLSVLPESFDLKVAAAVLGMSQILRAKKILQTLRRRSFLDSDSKSGLLTIHKLLQSFAKEKGEHEMKETILDAKSRLRAFYVSRFEELNEQFLRGDSMSAFVEFYKHEQGFLTSLIEGCYDSKTSDNVFRALVKAELFLDSLFWCEGEKIDKIYDSAIEAARKDENNVIYKQLLVSLALTEVPLGSYGRTMQLLSEGKYEPWCPSGPVDETGKHLCYSGIYQLVTGKTEDGVEMLEEALSLMDDTPERKILRMIMFQILAIYYRFIKNSSRMSMYNSKAFEESKVVGDKTILIIPEMKKRESENAEEEMVEGNPEKVINAPLTLEVICLVSKAIKHLHDPDTKQFISNVVLNIAKEFENPVLQNSLGLFYFQRNVNTVLENVSSKRKEAAKLSAERILYHEKAIEQCKSRKEPNSATLALHQEALAMSYADHGKTQHAQGAIHSALQSKQRSLNIRRKLFGEEHSSTADSYHLLSVTQHELGDHSSALQSAQRALDLRRKLFGEEHSSTAVSYDSVSIEQHELGDSSSALESVQRALDIRRKLFGEEHSSTADSYHLLSGTQHELGDYSSALQSAQRALDLRRKLFGEEHSRTAVSYDSVSIEQHELGDFSSALESVQRALDIRRKLFGEEHSSTAELPFTQCHSTSTQHQLHSVRWTSGENCLEKNTQALLSITIQSVSNNMSWATFPPPLSLYSVHWISGVNCLEKNTQARLTVTIYSVAHNMNLAIIPQLFSLHSVRWTSGENCLEKNTQALLSVTIQSVSNNMSWATFPPPLSLYSVHWISGVNCLEKNTQAQLTVTIHSVSLNIN